MEQQQIGVSLWKIKKKILKNVYKNIPDVMDASKVISSIGNWIITLSNRYFEEKEEKRKTTPPTHTHPKDTRLHIHIHRISSKNDPATANWLPH